MGAELDIYGPAQGERPLARVFGDFMRPPYFPVQFEQLRGRISFHDDRLLAAVRERSGPHGPDVIAAYEGLRLHL